MSTTTHKTRRASSPLKRGLGLTLLRVWLPIAIVVVWWFASANSTSLYFPPLSVITDELVSAWLGPRFVTDLLPSLGNFAVGFFLAVILGTGLGLLLGLSRVARDLTAPIVNFLRSLPPPALIPVVLILFGIGSPMSIALITLGGIWPTLLNTIDGVRSVDPQVRDLSRSYRLSRWQYISRIVLPNASPQIFAGYRITLQISIILIVVSEMVGSTKGLGFYVLQSQQLFLVPETWAGTIVLGVLGYLLTLIFVQIEKHVLRWQLRMRKAMGSA